jgi:glycosyltransferase involved in cell wall biosynthesis
MRRTSGLLVFLLSLGLLLCSFVPLVLIHGSFASPENFLTSGLKKEAQVTIGIKSSSRAHFVTRLLKSIHRHSPPGFKVIVVDDGAEALVIPKDVLTGVRVIQIEEDAGLAAGRNALIDAIDTKYMVYFDDDFVMTEKTNCMKMVEMMEKFPQIDVVGGLVSDRPTWGFTFRWEGRVLYQGPTESFQPEPACKRADIVPNFFAGRLLALRSIRWDDYFKLGEHEDFFLRAQGHLSVISCDFSSVQHEPQTNWYYGRTLLSAYEKRRRRALDYVQDFLKKHNIERYYTSAAVLLASNEEMMKAQAEKSAIFAKVCLDRWFQANPVTGILMSWKRRENIKTLLKQFEQLEGLTEVIVWNNDASEEFKFHKNMAASYKLKIFNSPENVNTLARWKACATMASNQLCFFIDDDFLPTSFTQLYYTYNRFPQRLNAATNTKVFWNNHRWAFYDVNAGIHTGFSWLGSGSLVSRKMATEFLERVLASANPDHLPIIDNYFSLWTNQYPVMMISDLKTGDLQQNFAYSVGAKVINELQEARIFAAETLVKRKSEWFGTVLKKEAAKQGNEVPVLAAAPSQKLILFTNKKPAAIGPSPISQIRNYNIWSYIHIPHEARRVSKELEPRFEHYANHSPLAAVDGNGETFWESQSPIKKSDYFALDLMRIGPIGRVHILTKLSHQELLVHISSDGQNWIELNVLAHVETSRCLIEDTTCSHLEIPLLDFQGRFVKFVAGWDFGKENFKIWEIYVETKNALAN